MVRVSDTQTKLNLCHHLAVSQLLVCALALTSIVFRVDTYWSIVHQASTFPTVVAYVMDTARSVSPVTFMSNMLYACSILYKTKLPFVVVMNKVQCLGPIPSLRCSASLGIVGCVRRKSWKELNVDTNFRLILWTTRLLLSGCRILKRFKKRSSTKRRTCPAWRGPWVSFWMNSTRTFV